MQQAISAIFLWLGERLRDLSMWPVNLVRDFPIRAGRLLRTLERAINGLLFSSPNCLTPSGIESFDPGRA